MIVSQVFYRNPFQLNRKKKKKVFNKLESVANDIERMVFPLRHFKSYFIEHFKYKRKDVYLKYN